MEEIELSKLFIFTGCMLVFVTVLFLGISFVTDCPKAMKRLTERIFKPSLSKERKFVIRKEEPGEGLYYYKDVELGYLWHEDKKHATRYTEEEVKALYDSFKPDQQKQLTIIELEK